MLADPDRPSAAAEQIGPESCDVVLCLYVLELVPTVQHAYDILRAAHRILRPGGVAFVQAKYPPSNRGDIPRRNYVRHLANMTQFGVDEFWSAAIDLGFDAHAVTLVPRNALDSRYAYFLLTRR